MAKLSMGLGCWTDVKAERGSAPMRWLGESGVIRSGCCSSIARSFAHEGVVLVVGDLRVVEHVVVMVVEVEVGLELGVTFGGVG